MKAHEVSDSRQLENINSGVSVRDVIGESSVHFPSRRMLSILTAEWDGHSRRVARSLAESSRNDPQLAFQALRALLGVFYNAEPRDQMSVLSSMMLVFATVEGAADRQSLVRDLSADLERGRTQAPLAEAVRACFSEMSGEMPDNVDNPGGATGALARKLRYASGHEQTSGAIRAVAAASHELEDQMRRSLYREVGHIFSQPKLRLGSLGSMEHGYDAVASVDSATRHRVIRELIQSARIPPYAQFDCEFKPEDSDARYLEYARFVGRTLRLICKAGGHVEADAKDYLEREFYGGQRDEDHDFRRAVAVAYSAMAPASRTSTDDAFSFFGYEFGSCSADAAMHGFLDLGSAEKKRCLRYALATEFRPFVEFFGHSNDHELRGRALQLVSDLIGSIEKEKNMAKAGRFLPSFVRTLDDGEKKALERQCLRWSQSTRIAVLSTFLDTVAHEQSDGDLVDSCGWAADCSNVLRGHPVTETIASRLGEIEAKLPVFSNEPSAVTVLADRFRALRDRPARTGDAGAAPTGLDT